MKLDVDTWFISWDCDLCTLTPMIVAHLECELKKANVVPSKSALTGRNDYKTNLTWVLPTTTTNLRLLLGSF